MTSRDPTLTEVIREAFDHRLASVRVAMPARVENYDPAAQTVDVQPLIKRIVGNGAARQARRLPMVSTVPVAFPRGGGFFVSFPIQPGDAVLLVIADRSIDPWFAAGGEVEPLDQRMHCLADAIAIPGIADSTVPLGDADASDMVLGQDGGAQIRIKADGEMQLGEHMRITPDGEILLGASASELVALATSVQDQIQSVIDWVKTHTHTAPTGPTTPPLEAPALLPAQSVAATKVKAE